MCLADHDNTLQIHQAIAKLHRFGIHDMFTIALATGYATHRDPKFQLGLATLAQQNMICCGHMSRMVELTPKGLESISWASPKTNAEAQKELFELISASNPADDDALEEFWKALKTGRKQHFYTLTMSILGEDGKDVKSYRGMEKMVQQMSNMGLLTWSYGNIRLTELAFPYGRGKP